MEFRFEPDVLKTLIKQTVAEVLNEVGDGRMLLKGRLAIDEHEAAELLSLNWWQLRDLRLAGKIGHSRIVGGRIRYTIEHLQDYLRGNDHTGK